jgi:hypothetical protein
MTVGTKPLRAVPAPPLLSPDVAAVGPAIPPIERLRYMSPKEWEDFIFEWAHGLKARYAKVDQCAGAGDMGRDIIGFASSTADDPWDNYQCKHYESALVPTDIWLELGKLAYYTYIGEYTLPRAYQFVAPRGAGNKLSKLLRKPARLRDDLISGWDKYCRSKITDTGDVVLDAGLKAHILAMDFSIFSAASPLTLLEEHSKTPFYTSRFGGGLPPRDTTPPSPPAAVAAHEATYVRALLDAYEDRSSQTFASIDDVKETQLTGHFARARVEFYSAESLRAFSRDNVPTGTFEALLDEVHHGVADVVEQAHPDGFECVLATVKQAKALQLTANALVGRTTQPDRGGMCHQLANDNRLRWRK